MDFEREIMDRAYHRFLWLLAAREIDGKLCPSVRGHWTKPKPDEYEFNRVVFGVNSSPFLAQFVRQQLVKDDVNSFPLAADTLQTRRTWMMAWIPR